MKLTLLREHVLSAWGVGPLSFIRGTPHIVQNRSLSAYCFELTVCRWNDICKFQGSKRKNRKKGCLIINVCYRFHIKYLLKLPDHSTLSYLVGYHYHLLGLRTEWSQCKAYGTQWVSRWSLFLFAIMSPTISPLRAGKKANTDVVDSGWHYTFSAYRKKSLLCWSV